MAWVPLASDDIGFTPDDGDRVLERMEAVAAARTPRQWMNIEPDVDPKDVPTGSVLFRVFSARGPVIPVGTWIPRHAHKGVEQAASFGLRHGTGKDGVQRLARAKAPMPGRWVIGQDHPKQGIIAYIHPDDTNADVLSYMCAAVDGLAPFDFDKRFIARFFST